MPSLGNETLLPCALTCAWCRHCVKPHTKFLTLFPPPPCPSYSDFAKLHSVAQEALLVQPLMLNDHTFNRDEAYAAWQLTSNFPSPPT